MDAREELIKEIEEHLDKYSFTLSDVSYVVADFVENDRKAVVAPLLKEVNFDFNNSSRDNLIIGIRLIDVGVKETLKNAGVES